MITNEPLTREQIWQRLGAPWDVLVIGGGITGAGILREASRLGLRALLVEERDFAWGTSSRSSKLVHGGLRYLKQGHIRLTRASVLERDRLLDEGPGLIDPLGFLLATYRGDFPGRRTFQAGLTVYDLLATQWTHRYYSAIDFQMLAPYLDSHGLRGGFRYGDAQTDDARLVWRVIQEAIADGAYALNYVRAETLLRETDPDHAGNSANGANPVVGAVLRDLSSPTERTAVVRARVVINATGAWADRLREQIGAPPRIRPLRGSHLIFPAWRFPVAQAISFLHPFDHRPVMILPWEGVTLVGTTDFDHDAPLDQEPAISPEETSYLMAGVEAQFPSLGIGLDDVISTFAGVRPVIGTGKADPSQESRDHVVWSESGLLTVTGGKLTTFRRIALDALKVVRHRIPDLPALDDSRPVLDPVDVALAGNCGLDEVARRRLLGRFGAQAQALIAAAAPGELTAIPGTHTLWAELRWGARSEGIVHLDDLLLRRTRLGLLLPQGGQAILDQVRELCQAELGWDGARWIAERERYESLYRCCYSLPNRSAIPDWRPRLAEAGKLWHDRRQRRRRRARRGAGAAGALLAASASAAFWYWRRERVRRA